MMRQCGFVAFAALCAMHSISAKAGCDFGAVDQRVQALLAQDGLSDAAVLIGSAQGIVYKKFYGSYDDTTVIPIASASKLLSGIRVMQLVDQGVLSLDAPLIDTLDGPDYPWSADAAPITLRQMFSHTAGYGDDHDNPDVFNGLITLAQSVQRIASDYNNLAPQNFLPAGSQFAYGSVSMQIGGQVVQLRSGMDWEQGWQQAIGAPLCSASIDWQGLTLDKSHRTLNYPIAAGAESTLDDYARVLAMLAGGGVGNGTRILSADALATLDHSQTGSATLGYAPPGAGGSTQYGIGAWIEPASTATATPTISSIGAYGFAPWVDFSNGTYGIVMVYDRSTLPLHDPSANSHDAIVDIIAQVRREVTGNGGRCDAGLIFDGVIFDAVFADGMETSARAPSCAATATLPQAAASYPSLSR
jgi:CubicO group peptidase (beta-lactamase class C family)